MKIKPYRDDNGEYRWSFVADNGNIIADSSEGYNNKDERDSMIRHIISDLSSGRYTFIEEHDSENPLH